MKEMSGDGEDTLSSVWRQVDHYYFIHVAMQNWQLLHLFFTASFIPACIGPREKEDAD